MSVDRPRQKCPKKIFRTKKMSQKKCPKTLETTLRIAREENDRRRGSAATSVSGEAQPRHDRPIKKATRLNGPSPYSFMLSHFIPPPFESFCVVSSKSGYLFSPHLLQFSLSSSNDCNCIADSVQQNIQLSLFENQKKNRIPLFFEMKHAPVASSENFLNTCYAFELPTESY